MLSRRNLLTFAGLGAAAIASGAGLSALPAAAKTKTLDQRRREHRRNKKERRRDRRR